MSNRPCTECKHHSPFDEKNVHCNADDSIASLTSRAWCPSFAPIVVPVHPTWIAGDYEYTVRARDESTPDIAHPDAAALEKEGWRQAWAGHTGTGSFFVYRRDLPVKP